MAFVKFPELSSGPRLLLVPAVCTAISAVVLLLHYVLSLKSVHGLLERVGILSQQRLKVSPPGIGHGPILHYRIARVLGCLGLFAVFIAQGHASLQGAFLSAPYLYGSILAVLSVSPKNARHGIVRHVNCVLFSSFCVYLYRDFLPLATFTRVPEDASEGRILWAKITLLFLTAVIIPLFTPRQYIPVDPLNPMPVVNPEQTVSIFSFSFYFFLDRIIFRAYRQSELKEDELYPLCDTDASAHLKARSFRARHQSLSSGFPANYTTSSIWTAFLEAKETVTFSSD
ncbi:hypothetical protein B0H10DRAFT_2233874 [Mycena sp. CBHHK59/15]|nr:hypothetical protein B0H10DRAFT_2233874 [Mycena sp. CBHHK59/15]